MECLRILKPGGHLLAFAGTRTQHRMAVNIEDAGFEIRDMIAWVYGSGFPKSHNIVIHDGSAEVLSAFPDAPGQQGAVSGSEPTANGFSGSVKYSGMLGRIKSLPPRCDAESSAARFFYCAKASRKDRNEGLADSGIQFRHGTTLRKVESAETKANNHPTVKPVNLMRYLCRLVTPSGGVILDPFMGSGSTGKAAKLEGFGFIGIERELAYIEIARARIANACALVRSAA